MTFSDIPTWQTSPCWLGIHVSFISCFFGFCFYACLGFFCFSRFYLKKTKGLPTGAAQSQAGKGSFVSPPTLHPQIVHPPTNCPPSPGPGILSGLCWSNPRKCRVSYSTFSSDRSLSLRERDIPEVVKLIVREVRQASLIDIEDPRMFRWTINRGVIWRSIYIWLLSN